MIKFALTNLFLALVTIGTSQNLVPNPSFELNDSCPTFWSQAIVAQNWFVPTDHKGTSDYFHSCAPVSSHVNVPYAAGGLQDAATGNAYMGIILFSDITAQYREYLQVELTAPLEEGEIYIVSFKYSLADEARCITDGLGVHFSDSALLGDSTYHPLNVTPQLNSTISLNERMGWEQLTFTYKSTGLEKFMTLGNFNSDANTSATVLDFTYEIPHAYIFIDDVEIIHCTGTVNFDDEMTLCEGDSILLQASSFDSSFLWQDGTTDSSYLITEAGTYWVEVSNSCGITRVDTLQVQSDPCEPTLENEDFPITLGPSPNMGFFYLNNQAPEPISGTFRIIDGIGKVVFKRESVTISGNGQISVQTRNLANGTYFGVFDEDGRTTTYRFVITH